MRRSQDCIWCKHTYERVFVEEVSRNVIKYPISISKRINWRLAALDGRALLFEVDLERERCHLTH